jgi:ferrous iron transport protein B
MIDELRARGGALKIAKLSHELGVKVVGVVGNRGLGIDDLRAELATTHTWRVAQPEIPIPTDQARRFVWSDGIIEEALTRPSTDRGWSDRVDQVVLHPVLGIGLFIGVMVLFFQIIFTVAAPLQELMEGGVALGGAWLGSMMSEGLFKSLLIDGVIAGVGGVVVFLPQIALLLLLIALLEGSGYMARAAFVIDRVMGWAGLEGRCFIALLSSYACAIPGIMATRSIPDPKSRLATIMAAPFMTCSARLPVYGLLIGAFVPATTVGGIFSLQGLVLFGLYALGSLSALLAGLIFKRGLLRGKTYPFYMELPPYRLPSWRVMLSYVWRGVKAFLRKAGGIILVASMVLWATLTFPQVEPPTGLTPSQEQAYQIEHSAAATVGKALEPVIAPLGFDWKIGVGLVASLAAREVIVATLAQIYAFEGGEDDVQGLGERMKAATREDGTPVYDLATVLSLLVFFVYALQCVSTLAVMRRETSSWRWPAIAFVYMTALAWVASFITYRLALWWA